MIASGILIVVVFAGFTLVNAISSGVKKQMDLSDLTNTGVQALELIEMRFQQRGFDAATDNFKYAQCASAQCEVLSINEYQKTTPSLKVHNICHKGVIRDCDFSGCESYSMTITDYFNQTTPKVFTLNGFGICFKHLDNVLEARLHGRNGDAVVDQVRPMMKRSTMVQGLKIVK